MKRTFRVHRAMTAWLSLALAAWLPLQAQADAPACEPRYPTPQTLASMFDMAKVTAEQLDAVGDTQVVLAARGGQDLSRYGLRHSHLAFLVREDDGRWQAVHLLNRCKTDASQLYREGLSNFVGESAAHSDLRIGVPTPALQQRLKALLSAPATQARTLHEPRYSMLAYPFRDEYQNSNQWILEVTAAAMAAESGLSLNERSRVMDWLKEQHYAPTKLHIGLGKRVGARFMVANVAVTDHPAGERISGNYSVVTVESVFDFLHQQQALARELVVAHQPAPAGPATSLAPATPAAD